MSLYDHMISPESKAVVSDWWKNLVFMMQLQCDQIDFQYLIHLVIYVHHWIKVVLPMETLSFASLFPEELDSFRNVTYVSEAEESKRDVEGDWERKLEGDSENNSDSGGSNDDNDFDYDTRNAFDAFEDMQWNILLLSFKYLSGSYCNTIFSHVKSVIPKYLLVDSYCFFNRNLLTSKIFLTGAEKVSML